MYQSCTELMVLVNGRVVDEYKHENQYFIEGRKGSEYVVRYRNCTSFRQKIVVSVDGLNVMSGDNTWEKGYVVNPYQVVDIPGWRKDSDNVAAFKFSSVRGSYNQHNETGKVQNVGVIGCRVYLQKPTPVPAVPAVPVYHHYHWNVQPSYNPPYHWTSWNTSGTSGGGGGGNVVSGTSGVINASFNACTEDMSLEPKSIANVGTGWGDNKQFNTINVNYEFEQNIHSQLLLYYDDIKGLRNRGINVKEKYYSVPNAFPGGDGCPPPVF